MDEFVETPDWVAMHWQQIQLQQLAENPCCGYQRESAASEPTALAALALLVNGQLEPALQAAEWLSAVQAADGSVGVRRHEPTPGWPTSLAVLTWLAARAAGAEPSFEAQIQRALSWMLSQKGKTHKRTKTAGHDSTLVAWPWVAGTHSWIEPTALHVIALKAAGHTGHPRVREAVKVLLDRQISSGGCNYGNTTILGQKLRPHVQPTGLAMLALAGEQDQHGRIQRSLDYLQATLSPGTPTVSLCWALLGLLAHRRTAPAAADWLAKHSRSPGSQGMTPLKRALICLAAEGKRFVDLLDSLT